MNAQLQVLRSALQRCARRLEPYDPDHPQAASFRARQLQAVLRIGPLMLLVNVVNSGLISLTFWDRVSWRPALALWFLAMLLLAARTARTTMAALRAPMRQSASKRGLRRVTVLAGLHSSLWSLPILFLFPRADAPGQLVLATVTTGFVCAGGFALATVPAAGSVYVIVLGTSGALSLFLTDFKYAFLLSGLLVMYVFIVLATVWGTARMFGARLTAEAEAERQNEVIGLLLRDFEENASDVLWEVDARGRLKHASTRLLSLFDLPANRLARCSVVRLLLRPTPEDASSGTQVTAIRHHIARSLPFRDLPLAIRHRDQLRWWSMSAKPLRDAQGRLIGWRGVASDITTAQQATHQLTWLAHFDPLTGLANRHQLRGRLAELLSAPSGEFAPFAVLCFDLDHFKTINDTLGHAIGDALLQEVARRLKACTRRSDTAARLGGDEFAILLRDVATRDEAEVLIRRMLDGLIAPCEVQGTRIAVQTSIGVALAPNDGREIDVLLNHADLALYAAKSAGRGSYRFFAPQMATFTRRRLLIEQELRGALARNELRLVFQPQVEVEAWRPIGFEALLRWHHAQLGEIPPGEFIAVAEDAGLISEIGAWALREACRRAVDWPEHLRVSVNVSSVQAMSPDLAVTVLEATRRAGLDPRRLEIEITESVFLDQSRSTLGVLHQLHDAGVRIALDDFGTGYSSLAYLRRFPFDTLKIDRSFVRELLQRRDARAIVRMIVGLSRTLHMKAIAEGVEEPAQASALRDLGCPALQGYLISRPLEVADVPTFLQTWAGRPPLDLPEHLTTTTATI